MIFYILVFLLAIALQWWMSGRRSPVPGLILPALHLILTIVLLLSFAAFSFSGEVSSTTVVTAEPGEAVIVQEESGNILSISSLPEEQATPDESSSIGIIGGADGPTAIFVAGPSDILSLLPAFLLLNIPTAAYLLIYIVQRRRARHHSDMDKTRIQDL